MAATHIRSNSFPSRSHPLSSAVEEQLQRLRSSEAASSSSSVCQKLGGLKDLYDVLDDWLQLSLTQQALSNQNNRQCVEDLLVGSLQTLDVYGNIQQVLSLMKESLRELASSLRRKTASSSNKISAYMASRKQMKKIICRTLEIMKKTNKKRNIVKNDIPEDEDVSLSFLREVEQISHSVFELVLSFLSKPKTRTTGWSLVSKVVSSKNISREESTDAREVEGLNADLLRLKSGEDKTILMHDVQKRVEALESSIHEIEEVSEIISRCLVKTRVSLLNSLNY